MNNADLYAYKYIYFDRRYMSFERAKECEGFMRLRMNIGRLSTHNVFKYIIRTVCAT